MACITGVIFSPFSGEARQARRAKHAWRGIWRSLFASCLTSLAWQTRKNNAFYTGYDPSALLSPSTSLWSKNLPITENLVLPLCHGRGRYTYFASAVTYFWSKRLTTCASSSLWATTKKKWKVICQKGFHLQKKFTHLFTEKDSSVWILKTSKLLVRFLPLALWLECQNITNCCVIFSISPAFHTFRILTSCPFLLPPTPPPRSIGLPPPVPPSKATEIAKPFR